MSESTGFRDTAGGMICYGDHIRIKTEGTQHKLDMFGAWSTFVVIRKVGLPVLSYVESATGNVLLEGSQRSFLHEEYDRKSILFSHHPASLLYKPMSRQLAIIRTTKAEEPSDADEAEGSDL